MLIRFIAALAMVFASVPALAAPSFAASPEPGIVFPVAGENHYTDTFGACRGAGCSRSHEGIDIMSAKMTPVVAAGSGWVRYVNWSSTEEGIDPNRCCTLAIQHDNGWESWYIHLNNDSPGTDDGLGWGIVDGIVPGVRVEAGQHVGWVGDSGNAENAGSHTHFEYHDPDRVVINPYPYLQDAQQPEGLSQGAGARRGCDFDGNGSDDIAVGSPDSETGGSTWLTYGGSGGLGGSTQQITQDTEGIPGIVEAGDGFGSSVACGDANGDGYDDLAIGASGEDIGSRADAGYVTIIHGSSSGLVFEGAYGFSQATAGVAGAAEADDRFGTSIATGDFDGDGFDDLVVGMPGEDIGSRVDSGASQVMYGSASGINADRDKIYSQATSGVAGAGEAGDLVGFSVAAGDLNGDGIDDLIMGAPGEDVGSRVDAGAVNVLYGKPGGITTSGDRVISQASSGVAGAAEAGDQMGYAVSAGDIDDDGYDDLIVGAPGEDVGSKADAGAVNVLYGSPSGPTGAGDEIWSQSSSGVQGAAEPGDRFGGAVSSADVNGDGFDDLVVGVPGEDVGSIQDAGLVALIPGSSSGLTAAADVLWIEAIPSANSRFGYGVGAGQIDSGGPFEVLAIGDGTGRTVILHGDGRKVAVEELGAVFAQQIAG